MKDKELLELAAKAAGIEIHHWTNGRNQDGLHECPVLNDGINEPIKLFDPLTDDGDALRLAVKLRLFPINLASIDLGEDLIEIDCKDGSVLEPLGSDHYAAIRRAIVRAAAEIGKVMK